MWCGVVVWRVLMIRGVLFGLGFRGEVGYREGLGRVYVQGLGFKVWGFGFWWTKP
jgi:hypothetical protein